MSVSGPIKGVQSDGWLVCLQAGRPDVPPDLPLVRAGRGS